mmetsp:Transcript_2193/g.2534  ORF Transcript_2193/g.2534 Transcript_2193/m.2534 type:complete len:204 (+) Transcript_2193:594-1205(+)|eukprot:CAMPEP_0205826108 /NCGR_PEP_ID=MMETSP0206-20130828/27680_1 /ASSEMBLY_ACC=CAM_ASM_000279 /TAXON_ID=36767 /ORGANISM="Euplotes focardii, Strain TN1" /LENGTH=203 /DNA_ID=CAMNT_0053125787 /DNA_START=594 /DNA_END=1205 /DNA_ORIENTATION=+
MDKFENRAKQDDATSGLRATFRVTETSGNGDAYYYKDEDDKLIDIELEGEADDKGKLDKYLSVTTNNNRINDSIDQESNDLSSLDGSGSVKDKYGINSNSDMAKTMNKPMVPKIGELEEASQEPVENENRDSKIDPELKDKIGDTKIEKSKDLTSFIVEDHVDEEDILRQTDKGSIQEKGGVRKRAHRTRHKIVWSMLKMKKT